MGQKNSFKGQEKSIKGFQSSWIIFSNNGNNLLINNIPYIKLQQHRSPKTQRTETTRKILENVLSRTKKSQRHLRKKKLLICGHEYRSHQSYDVACSFRDRSSSNPQNWGRTTQLSLKSQPPAILIAPPLQQCLAHLPVKMAESHGQTTMDKQCEKKGSESSVSEIINKQGWLWKRSRLYKRWDKCWCCLKKNELSYGTSAEVWTCQHTYNYTVSFML